MKFNKSITIITEKQLKKRLWRLNLSQLVRLMFARIYSSSITDFRSDFVEWSCTLRNGFSICDFSVHNASAILWRC